MSTVVERAVLTPDDKAQLAQAWVDRENAQSQVGAATLIILNIQEKCSHATRTSGNRAICADCGKNMDFF